MPRSVSKDWILSESRFCLRHETDRTTKEHSEMIFDISLIRKLAKHDRVAFKRHAVIRMQQRAIRADDVREILLIPEIIEEYPNDHPLPSALLFGITPARRVIHAVVAIDPTDDGMLWVITVYEPDQINWCSDYKTRRTSDVVSTM